MLMRRLGGASSVRPSGVLQPRASSSAAPPVGYRLRIDLIIGASVVLLGPVISGGRSPTDGGAGELARDWSERAKPSSGKRATERGYEGCPDPRRRTRRSRYISVLTPWQPVIRGTSTGHPPSNPRSNPQSNSRSNPWATTAQPPFHLRAILASPHHHPPCIHRLPMAAVRRSCVRLLLKAAAAVLPLSKTQPVPLGYKRSSNTR